VLCCDNLPGNGRVVDRLVREFCAALPPADDPREWIESAVRFPSCMVDRIVPATAPADRAAVARTLGVFDQAAVVAEPFGQWVIEDTFLDGRPAWDAAGALLTDDVARPTKG
jgi:fructuronate reductase